MATRHRASASPRARPARSTSAPPGRRCSTTSSRGTPAARSSCASRTPTSPAARSAYEKDILDGLHWLGLELGRGPGGRRRGGARAVRAVPPDGSACRSTPRRPSACSPRTWPTPATARPRSSPPTGKAQEAAKQPPRYVGRCATLTADERAAREAEGRRGALRFRVGEGVVAFDDLVRGHVEIDIANLGGDFVIVRARRHAALPLHGRRRRRGDGDQPRHPRRGPPLEHAQAHPAVPGARPRRCRRSPTCRSSSTPTARR